MIRTSFAIIRQFFCKVSYFKTLLPTLSKTLHTAVVRFPASISEHIASGARKLKTIYDNACVEFGLTETWKTFVSFTTMPGLTPACADARQSQKWGGLFFLILLTANIWHPPLPPGCLCKRCSTWTPFCGWQLIETRFSWCTPKSRQEVLQHWYTPSCSTLPKLCWEWPRLCGKIAYSCEGCMNHPCKFYCYCSYFS
jgi:hypothetical protein